MKRRSEDGPGGTTPARILEAAAREFAAEGFGGARVERIARGARANKAMLYYHVGDKAALYEAVLVANFERVGRAIQTALATAAPAEDKLRALISAIFGFLETNPGHGQIMLRELASGAPNLTPEVERRMSGIFETVFGLLEQGIEAGSFRPVAPLLAHLMLLGGLLLYSNSRRFQQSVVSQMSPRIRKLSLPAKTDVPGVFADLLLNGLRSSAASERLAASRRPSKRKGTSEESRSR
jgi:TetR/AcrR family transcriptional regulator